MARKRKQGSTPSVSAEVSQPPKRQQQQQIKQEQQELQQLKQQQEAAAREQQVAVEYEEVEEEVEEVEEEEEEEEEEEVEEEEEEEDEDEDEDEEEEEEEDEDNQTANEDDDEPIQKLLEPFSKDQLIALLFDVATAHRDVADRIRQMADVDPVHRKIFVHGLGWDATAETLTSAFKQYGEIENCKAVCDKVSGKSKGYGFILFKTRRGARNALKEPQKKIGNRMTACQLASTGPVPTHAGVQSAPSQQQQQQQQQVSEYTQRKIYVSNVGAELDPKKLTEYFAKFGEIEEGPLGLDKLTGKPKGFCLFVYKAVESAKKALEEPHKSFEGQMLHCQKAIDGPKPGKSQHVQHQNANNPQSQRNDSAGFAGAAAAGLGQLNPAGIGFGQGAAAAQALNPALGQALTALLATQGAGLGLTNFLGTLGSATAVNPAMPTAGHGLQAAYGSQMNISPGLIGGGYGSQAGYANQQMGQGAAGRGQHAGQFSGSGPYMSH